MEVKLRTIVGSPFYTQGFTVPNEIAIFFSGCVFDVVKSGNCILFSSGTPLNPTYEQLRDYKFEDCRLGGIYEK